MLRYSPSLTMISKKKQRKVTMNILSKNLTTESTQGSPKMKLRRLPGTWDDPEAQREEFRRIGERLGLKNLADWYKVTQTEIAKEGGLGIVKRHKNLPSTLLFLFPDHNWEPWRFQKRSLSSRFDEQTLRTLVERIAASVGVKAPEDWYSVEYRQFIQFGAKAVLRMFEDSPYKLLKKVYPNHAWQPWRFTTTPHGFWPDVKNQRIFMEHLLQNIKGWKIPEELDRVYTLKRSEIRDAGGRTLLTYYDHTVARLFTTIFPEHKWEEWKFYWASPLTFWSRQAQAGNFVAARSVLESIGKTPDIDIQELSDWYRVGMDVLTRYRAQGMVKAFGGLFPLLRGAYPEHAWDESQFFRSSKASTERLLGNYLHQLFASSSICSRYRMDLKKDIAGSAVDTPVASELDFYIPDLKLAFEYQGVQHYSDVYSVGQSRAQQETDSSKSAACAALGITLIEVPYTADISLEYLQRLIVSVRPDLKEQLQKTVSEST